MFRTTLLLTVLLSTPALALPPGAGGNVPLGSLSPSFDGATINSSLVQSMAEADLLGFSYCEDDAGDPIDDCVVLHEQPSETVFATRVVVADSCSNANTDGCHAGWIVATEFVRTVTDDSTDGVVSIAVEETYRERPVNPLGVVQPLALVATTHGTVTLTSSTRLVEVDVFDGAGLWQGGDDSFSIASGGSLLCDNCTDMADVVQGGFDWMGDATEALLPSYAGIIGGAIGAPGVGTAFLGAVVGTTVGYVVAPVFATGWRVTGVFVRDLGYSACEVACEEDLSLEIDDDEGASFEPGYVEDGQGGAANPTNDMGSGWSGAEDDETGTTPRVFIGDDGSIIVIWPDGTTETYPPGSAIFS